MKKPIKRLSADELRITTIHWIASVTEWLTDAIPGRTERDIDAAIDRAVDLSRIKTTFRQGHCHQRQNSRRNITRRHIALLCMTASIIETKNQRPSS